MYHLEIIRVKFWTSLHFPDISWEIWNQWSRRFKWKLVLPNRFWSDNVTLIYNIVSFSVNKLSALWNARFSVLPIFIDKLSKTLLLQNDVSIIRIIFNLIRFINVCVLDISIYFQFIRKTFTSHHLNNMMPFILKSKCLFSASISLHTWR